MIKKPSGVPKYGGSITIQDWMVRLYFLQGDYLLVYATIHSFSKDGESVIFMMVDVALGGIPKIGILSDAGDYMLDYDKALSHMVEFFYDAQEGRPTTNIAIQSAQQRSIQAEVSACMEYQMREEMARIRTAHYDDGYEPVFDEDVLRDRVQLILKGVYNFDYIPDL